MNYDWVSYWVSYFANIAVTALVASGIGYFIFKTMFKGWVDKRIEIELAKVKGEIQGELDYKATKHKFVYERKITALCNVLQKIWLLEKSMGNYFSLWNKKDHENIPDSGKNCVKCWEDLADCFEPNRMFFTEELINTIESLRRGNIEATKTLLLFLKQEADEPGNLDREQWLEVNEFFKRESPKLRRAIEQELRQEFQE